MPLGIAEYSSTAYTPDRLVAGNSHHILSQQETLISGQNLTRGAVLGRITASGKVTLSDDGAADGSQTPVGILAVDTDASGGDVTTPMYIAGEFNENELTLAGAHTADSIREGLRDKGIFLVNPPVNAV